MSKFALIDILRAKSPASDLQQRRDEISAIDERMRAAGARGNGFADMLVPLLMSKSGGADVAAKARAAAQAQQEEAQRQSRLMSAVIYSPTPVYDKESSAPSLVPLADVGLTLPRSEQGFPLAIDTSRLQPGDLEYMQAQAAARRAKT